MSSEIIVVKRKCDTCKFCVLEDVGYSNYTVEGTYVHCAKKIHPESGFDRFYGEDKRLEFASECNEYEKGSPVEVDVERENSWSFKDIKILNMWGGL